VTDVAFATGFQFQPVLATCFRRRFKISPGIASNPTTREIAQKIPSELTHFARSSEFKVTRCPFLSIKSSVHFPYLTLQDSPIPIVM